jgi:hypothetical protein
MSKVKKPQDAHHEELVSGLADQMKQILESSEQAMYIYLDDTHKMCNSNFAKLLGYESPKEWADIQGSLEPFVEKKSHEVIASAYWKAVEKFVASSVKVTWKKKHGGCVDTNVILVPMAYKKHILAVHFVEMISEAVS